MLPFSARSRVVVFWTVTFLVAVLVVARIVDPLREGLNATYFSDANWSSPLVRTTIDARMSTEGLFAGWHGQPPEVFSVTWSGAVIALLDDTYTFATTSDDGSSVFVDGRLVVDNGGVHASRLAMGSVHLERGTHRLFVKYFQNGGRLDFQLRWARGMSPLEPMPSWALTPRAPRFAWFFASVVARRLLRWTAWAWLGVVVVFAVAACWESVAAYLAAPFVPSFGAMLLVIGALLSLLVLPHQIASDGRRRYFELAELIEWHEVSPLPYSLVGPLFSAPLYFVGRAVLTPEWWCERFNTIVFIAGIVVVYRLWRERIEAAVLIPFLLLLMAGSMFPFHLEGYFGEVFTTVLVGVGLAAVAVGQSLGGWTAAIIGVANIPASLVGLGCAAVLHAWRTRTLRHLAPPFVAAGLIMAESWIRRGSPLASGYEGNAGVPTMLTYTGRPGFSYPLFFGLLSVLLSFGKGLIFYAPGLLLSIKSQIAQTSRAVVNCYSLWLAFLAGLIVVYSKWWAWYGGEYWGPRFFLFASLPASLAIAVRLTADRSAPLRTRLGLFAVLTLSVWIAIDGVAFALNGLDACRDVNYGYLCLYVPEFSPLWRPFVQFTTPTADRIVVCAYFCVVYLYLAAPLGMAISRRTLTLASDFVTAHADLERWHV